MAGWNNGCTTRSWRYKRTDLFVDNCGIEKWDNVVQCEWDFVTTAHEWE